MIPGTSQYPIQRYVLYHTECDGTKCSMARVVMSATYVIGYAQRTFLAQVPPWVGFLTEAMAASCGYGTRASRGAARAPGQANSISDETPPRVSVVDVILAMTRKSANSQTPSLDDGPHAEWTRHQIAHEVSMNAGVKSGRPTNTMDTVMKRHQGELRVFEVPYRCIYGSKATVKLLGTSSGRCGSTTRTCAGNV